MKVRNGYLDLVGKQWEDSYASEFVARGCTGVLVGAPGGPPIPDVSFLTRIPGLRGVGFMRGVKDISAVSRVPGLRELNIASDYKGPFSFDGLEELEALSMPFLPSAAVGLSRLSRLRDLMVAFWPKGVAVDVLGAKPELEALRLEFKRGVPVSSAGFAGAPALQRLSLYDGALTDVDGFAGLAEVREFHLYGTKLPALDFVAGMPHLDWLYLENCGEVASLEPLRGHPSVRVVSISGTKVATGDWSPLSEMPAAKEVTPHP
jgi:hypothetical protein